MFFGPSLGTMLGVGSLILIATNAFTAYTVNDYAKAQGQIQVAQCQMSVVRAARGIVSNRRKFISVLDHRASKRVLQNMSARERRLDRYQVALEVISTFPGLKNCKVPAELREAISAIK